MDLNIYGSHDVDICLFGCLQYFFAGHWLPVLPPAVTVNTGMLSYLLHCVSLCWLFVLLLHLLLSSSQCCLFTAVRTVPSSNCSAVFTANGCKPSPVLTFFTQLPKTDSRARERDGEVAWGKNSSCSNWRGFVIFRSPRLGFAGHFTAWLTRSH